ncbi:MAG: hypothetical protein K2Y14_01265 [Burkholderiales bacterium]|nr:hypothetical protein [Burkholderiales bacterium]
MKFKTVFVGTYFKTAQMIAENACDKDIFLKFEGFVKASAYIDKKTNEPKAQLSLTCFDITVIKDSSDESIDQTNFDPEDFSGNVDDLPPQF